ncbi:hypothetical protein GCM10023115_25240 [Pontixanthobacter gangjinensis]|uniref:asparagine synthase (glutamine-hydrolyzing) n=1 Tax=Christiangramia aestuarii TaxID=1028746 RepID=A0A7M3SYS8_9FLAO|nr:asparagine synthase-related protein [Christiangramia aestuarii]MUP41759.1 hypothetical protein [Christiangramia aestuarii]
MKFLFTNKEIDHSLSKDFQNLIKVKLGNFSALINDTATVSEKDNLIGITNGYLRNYHHEGLEDQKTSAEKHVFENWPVKKNITGSFSTLIYDTLSSEIVVTSDLCNIYPIYYLKTEEYFFISNSIILMGRYSKAQLDKTGIFQRAVGPNFSNIGSRTILENCKRLLPGEWLKFSSQGEIIEKKYDNSLYSNLGSVSTKPSDLKKYWEQYKKEVNLCLQEFKQVNIALSGGIDSRIALGAIPMDRKISARTFGNSKNYESKIAEKLAKRKGAKHQTYFDPKQYFPKKSVLKDYIRETESLKLNSWLEILENIEIENKEPILLGELCEALPARNIKKFNSSKFRNKNFFKYYIKNASFDFTPSNPEDFNNWQSQKIKRIISWHDDNWFKKLGFEKHKSEIIDETIQDTHQILKRIESHNLPYIELYDELFSWFTFTRMELSRQVNICNEKFYAFSPGMSIQMLRLTSNIHPNDRLYYRFANRLMKEIPDLKMFSKVPTSQIPLIPQGSPNIIKIPIWGLRSKIDDYFVKRLMKTQDQNKRYRLFKSINWVKVYQQKNMLNNIQAYYSRNHLSKSYFEIYYDVAKRRKELINWPFANMDIISGASLNVELDLIKNPPD